MEKVWLDLFGEDGEWRGGAEVFKTLFLCTHILSDYYPMGKKERRSGEGEV